MQAIRVRGSFGYATTHALDTALTLARHQLGDDRWLRSFERIGATLRVDVTLPVDRDVAIGVLETLADAATYGVVEMDGGDWFSANCND